MSSPNGVQRWASASAVRKQFIEFFEQKKGHTFWASSPVVPYNDPTLLFINAGMNQFKPIFTGNADKNTAFGNLKRAANSQKCIRAGGKHNDLEDVGKDVYHHTFFEMLGNWSFGDYFKKEAIDWAWELLTEVFCLPKDRLYVTYFGGDPKEPNCQPDLEARDLWLRYLPAERVLPFDMKDNFWEMGDTGPCGPCSEIHFDRIGGRDAAALVNADDPDVLEIWNLVFMQYNRNNDRSLSKLPFGSVDTGMGLERLVSVLQNVRSNYDTDIFRSIFEEIQKVIPGLRPYTGKVGEEDSDRVDMAYRVVADHIRTLSIAIADGALPSNQGRGYVLRRILRRAVRYGRQNLKAPKQVWFAKLVDVVVANLGSAFPELESQKETVKQVIKEEEEQFSRALDSGLREFERTLKAAQAAGKDKFPGGTPGAFELYTTYGFPLDLTALMAEEAGFGIDDVEFQRTWREHQEKSKQGGGFKNKTDWTLSADQIALLSDELKVPPTDDSFKYDWNSLGHGPSLKAKILAIYTGKDFVEMAQPGQSVGLVFDRSNYYAEMGGQIFDTGRVEVDKEGGGVFHVEDCQKFGPYLLHVGTLAAGEGALSKSDDVVLTVDFDRRAAIAKNHTGTHLLNFALRKVLGENCDQKGSLVEAPRLRFDFSWSKPVDVDEIEAIEGIMRSSVRDELEVHSREVPLSQAREITGLRAMFGEQYPDPVRLITVGAPIDALLDGSDSQGGCGKSVEFCGGTHIQNSREIAEFAVLSEEGIQKGVRRIVAVTGEAAQQALSDADAFEGEMKALSSFKGAELDSALAAMRARLDASTHMPLSRRRRWINHVEELKKQQLEFGKAATKALQEGAKEMGRKIAEGWGSDTSPFKVHVIEEVQGDTKAMDVCAKTIQEKLPGTAFALLAPGGGVLSCVTIVPKDSPVSGKLSAKDWLIAVMGFVGGKGGGKPDRAIGSAKDFTSDKLEGARQAAVSFAEEKTK
uniref:Alanine--tRNA ligase n=1 Tax=Chromera velia CCMP2878 TaxID=1169474 RepID=A0A0G4FYV9_9ALVE|mmetsp:Transcript_48034/g.94874  ORF Transcript_48034/g.94874 Transcript_48034/m.94874 type:complete len:976 (+) Transcript_48034:124-3051(+)|eukprot:Cvel_19371.t1-p1 / transcript=Cvel_19371.t1 / gene=Cvel_19371 / organism=Chromera_velia_CCMP2878 / gene_product=Alanine--tRNA ligase, putative / transcript_product=Alanine--tRNA ligase, putative / location=Cvel_scaffold1665:5606-9921(-) / protein_length=975 / sequence_SO=supercontig / SO=protein_coding / is_pseudo=false